MPHFLCVFQEKASLSPPLSLDWEEEMATAQPHDCVPVASNHPLYVLYTSGTTGTPKVQQQRQMEITANESCEHICTQSSCRTSCCCCCWVSSAFSLCKTIPVQHKHHHRDIKRMGPFHSTSWRNCLQNSFQTVSFFPL